jgi:hypothetical protein
MQDDGDLVGVGDDMVIGCDQPRRIDDETGTERGGAPRLGLRTLAARQVLVEEVLEELLERRAGRELRHFRTLPVGLQGLGRRDVDDRRQELGRELGEAIGSRLGEGGRCSKEQRNGEDEGQG